MLHNDYQQLGGETLTVDAQLAGLQASGIAVERLSFSNEGLQTTTDVIRRMRGGAVAAEIAEVISRFEPSVVHAHNLFPFVGAAAWRAIHRCGDVPYVQHLHNYRFSCLAATHFREGMPCHKCSAAATAIAGVRHRCYRDSFAASVGAVALDAQRRAYFRRHPPDAYIAVSSHLREQLQGVGSLGKVPCYVLGNSLSADPGVGPGGQAFTFVGRLEPEKGVRRLLRLCARLPEVPFVIVGDGSLRDEVAAAGRTFANLTFVGELSPTGALELMGNSRALLVLPEWGEPFGRVAVEGLARGTPIIATSYGALPEVVGAAGAILADDDEFADCIRRYHLAGAPATRQLRLAARARFEAAFANEARTTALISIYTAVLAKRAPS